MAAVIIEIKRTPCTCNASPQQTTQRQGTGGKATRTKKAAATTTTKNPTLQRVAQRAATLTAAAPASSAQAAVEVPPVSYATALTLIAFIGGIYFVSQYNGKKH